MQKTIYIAGKVTGVEPEACARKFEVVEIQIKARGYNVINPIKLVNDPNCSWQKAMKICLHAIKDVDGVFMLPCSDESDGAKIEHQYAIELKKEIYTNIHEL